jgi:hypothetical protein
MCVGCGDLARGREVTFAHWDPAPRQWDSRPVGSCRSWRAADLCLILVQIFDSLSSAMRLTTILTTIWVCPLESVKVQNPYLQGKSDVRGRTRTRCRCLTSKGSAVRVCLLPPSSPLVRAMKSTRRDLERSRGWDLTAIGHRHWPHSPTRSVRPRVWPLPRVIHPGLRGHRCLR